MADAAGREHHGARGQRQRFAVRGAAQAQPSHRAVLDQQFFGAVALDHLDRGRLAHGIDQRGDDGLAGAVALNVDNAARGMGGFAADCELAFEVAVERHAVAQKILDAARRFPGETMCDRFIDDAATHRDGVARV